MKKKQVTFKNPKNQEVYNLIRTWGVERQWRFVRIEEGGTRYLVLGEDTRLSEPEPGILVWEALAADMETWEKGYAPIHEVLPTPAAVAQLGYNLHQRALAKAAAEVRRGLSKHAAPRTEVNRLYMVTKAMLFGPGFKPALAHKWVGKALWNEFLDKDALRIAASVWGTVGLTLANYAFVRKHQRVLTRLHQETPELMPWLRQWRSEDGMDLNVFGNIRQRMISEQGLTPQAWRWLTRQSPAAKRLLLSRGELDGNYLAGNYLAQTGEAMPYTLATAWLASQGRASGLNYLWEAASQDPVASRGVQGLVLFLRLALREAKKRKGRLKAFARNEFTLALDWLSAQAMPASNYGRNQGWTYQQRNPLPANSTWNAIMRAQEKWHEEVALSQQGAYQEWQSALPAREVAGVQVTPLADSHALWTEGNRMHHCVSSYAATCLHGHSRIFSLESGKDRATLELSQQDGKWRVVQVRGYCNKQVSKAFEAVAKNVAKLYQQAADKENQPAAMPLAKAA